MPPIYANGHISATGIPIPFMSGWGFRGRRIERRYLRFEQIQDGGRRHVGKISNGHISATGRISPQRLTIYVYSAHRAVIFAMIAQLSYSIYIHFHVRLPVSCEPLRPAHRVFFLCFVLF